MITFSMVQAIHVDSFLALDEDVTIQARYVARLAGSWTFRDAKGMRIPLGDVEALSESQQAELIAAFQKAYVDKASQKPRKKRKVNDGHIQTAEI